MTLVGTVYTYHYTRCRRRRRTSSNDTRGGRYTVDCSLQRRLNLWLINSLVPCVLRYLYVTFLAQVNPVVHSTRGLLGYSRVPYHTNAAEPADDGTAAPPTEQAPNRAVYTKILIERAVGAACLPYANLHSHICRLQL